MMRPGFQYQARPFRFLPALGLCGRRRRGLSPAADVRTWFALGFAGSHPVQSGGNRANTTFCLNS